MSTITTVVCVTPESGRGWAPVTLMAKLAAHVFGARLLYLHPAREYSTLLKVASFVPRPSGKGGVLAIVAHPGDLLALAEWRFWRLGGDPLAAWIIDSFWSERLPRFARQHGIIDALFVTDHDLVDYYASATGSPAHYLPWGADTLAVRRIPAQRSVDVVRIGRQPVGWDDDIHNAAVFANAGLKYAGRPAFGGSADANQENLFSAMVGAKTVMAWGNKFSPALYTHPTRDYISARWTDAVAAGAQVLGIPPRAEATRLLGPEALIVPEGLSPAQVLTAALSARDTWTRDRSERIRLHAIANLDWRHRFARMAELLGVTPLNLDSELAKLRATADRFSGGDPDAG